MENYQLKDLFNRYLENRCSAVEVEILIQHFNVGDLALLSELIYEELATLDDAVKDPHLVLLVNEAYTAIDARITEENTKQVRMFRVWPNIAVAAAAIATLVFSVWFFEIAMSPSHVHDNWAYENDIKPGKNSATLTLANGKAIALSATHTGVIVGASKITYSDGTDVTTLSSEKDQSSVQYQTIKTPRGGTYQVTLNDGTKIWLNAFSSLTYAASLSKRGERCVILEGEAYFEVTKDKKHPFVVESKNQKVEVLGTHFNISAYDGDPSIRTTLVEGSVKVKTANVNRILKANQQALLNGSNIDVLDVEAKYAIAWKNNNFVFANERIETVMKMVERWYDVDVVYEERMPQDRFRGSVSRFDNVSKVLNILEATGLVHFRIKDRRIYVSR